MNKRLVLAAVCVGLMGGCSAGYDIGMKVEKSQNDFEILMGTFDGSMALIHGDPKNATITATNGDLTCNGVSNSGTFSTDMVKNKVKHLFKVTCSDGRTGNLTASITARPNGGFGGANIVGAGIGKLNDGSKLKIVFGDASATLGW